MLHQRTHISTTDETYDDVNHYTPSSRPHSQSTIQINNNEVKKTSFCEVSSKISS